MRNLSVVTFLMVGCVCTVSATVFQTALRNKWRQLLVAPIAACALQVMTSTTVVADASVVSGKTSLDGEALRVFQMARQVEGDGDYATALKLYQQIVQAEPEYIYGWSNLGNVLAATGNLDQSLLCYKKALNLRPPKDTLSIIILNKASVENGLDHLDTALKDITAAESIAGETQTTMSNKAVVLTKLGRWKDASEVFEKIISSADRYAQPWWLRYSMSLLETGRGMESVAFLQRVLNRFPEETECKAYAAAVYSSLGSVAEGRRYWTSIPDSERTQYTVDFVQNQLKWGSTAVASFSKFLKWRSVAALEGSVGVKHVEPMASKTSIMSPPKLSKESPPRVWSPVQIDLRVDSNEAEVVVREAPYLLMKTHFECEKFSLDTILDTIEQTLNDSIENAYEFVASECTWRAVTRHGSTRCKFQVNVYKGCGPSTYIIEGHKLTSGDGSMFRAVYEEIKSKLSAESDQGDANDMSFVAASAPLPTGEFAFTESEIKANVSRVVSMCRDKTVEAAEAAVWLLHDMSMHNALLQNLCTADVMDFLLSVLAEEYEMFDNAKHGAVMTLGNISESIVGQAALVDAGVISPIMKLACNGPYSNIDMRRESARILANVASKLASKVTGAVSAAELDSWLSSVDDLEDDRLRMHAERAKEMMLAITA